MGTVIMTMPWFRSMLVVTTLIALGGVQPKATGASPSAGWERFYIGTYTWNSSKGIYRSGLDLGTGTLSPTNLAGAVTSPSFVALHPNRRFLYAVNEDGGKVVAFSVNSSTGALTLLNQQDSNGASPCHVVVDRSGRNVLAANYTGGSVTVFPIQADGRLGAATAHIQHAGASPHAHCVALDGNNRFALVCDLGLDQIMCYRFDPELGTLAVNTTPWTSVDAGSGPRHLTFDPQYRRVYAICEKSATIIGFHYDSTNGTLISFQTISTLPAGYAGQKSAAEIAFHPSGKFLYGSNRGYNSIAVFAVDPQTVTLTLVQQQTTGQTPRSFAVDPAGAFLLAADQDSDDVRLYTVHPQTGLLSETGQKLALSKPVCVLPFITQPPQPVLQAHATAANTLSIDIGNSLAVLTYELYQAPVWEPGMTWNLLASGAQGQSTFALTNGAPQGFIRASVVTNY
jgi:6-phosphogluconolactonase